MRDSGKRAEGAAFESLRCPATGRPLARQGDRLVTDDGERSYPVVEGVPIVIAEERSLFRLAAFTDGGETSPAAASRPPRLLRAAARRLPRGDKNVVGRRNYRRLAELLREGWSPGERPREVLVVGGGVTGAGMDELYDRPWIRLTETDVFIGPRTAVVCDGHDLPFQDGTFAAVVCQAVLEHVVGPARVVEEIHRVLRPTGVVYSEVPFIQQVHEGAHDVTRWTMLGHRILYDRFDEIESGTACGPGMALAWSVRYFASSFTRSRVQRALADALASIAVFWLTVFDSYLARQPAALDAASATYFLGRRRETAIPDGELLRGYRGNFPTPSGYSDA